MCFVASLLVLFHLFAPAVSACQGMQAPVEGVVGQRFDPIGRYGGHWGIDYLVSSGTLVKAAGSGSVIFSGVVVGNRTVTIDHGAGIKTSYSYLSEASVLAGESINRGATVGLSGSAHGTDGLHFSTRVGSTYVDPSRLLACTLLDPAVALRLVPASRGLRRTAYPDGCEKGHSRWHVRSATSSTSHCRRSGLPATEPRRGLVRSGRPPLAEG